ncbi:hypothetical protein SteCoe_18796 [Stentor coeruleus]|uniref:THH1/TOM1/TOM3 domain-containing protein n=1 Tax=Stentor coeruleus TaxID=5963 RepID=A0A1R2BVT7_9CILI|nr:hypothetical protein SteCoe_18796 [Stentor coeruleus]
MEGKIVFLVDYGLLGTIVLSSISCLARADFNFIFSLVTYYLWINLKNKEEDRVTLGKKILFLNAALLILDLVCLVSLSNVWGEDNDVYASIHNFVLFISWLNFFVKIGIILAILYIFKDDVRNFGPAIGNSQSYDIGNR